tara:strand:+ start:769 stop:1242 length:474 start_codon:yes stop_codon:yes gene_type:complete
MPKEKLNIEDEEMPEMLTPSEYPANLKIEIVEASGRRLSLAKIASTSSYKRAWTLTRPFKKLIETLTGSSDPEDRYKAKVLTELEEAKKLSDIAGAVKRALAVNPASFDLDGIPERVITDIDIKAWNHFSSLGVELGYAKKLAKLLSDGISVRYAKK